MDAVVSQLKQEFPSSALHCLLEAASLLKLKKLSEAIQVLEKAIVESETQNSGLVVLALAQIHLNSSRPNEAVQYLQKLPSLKYLPSWVATIVALLEKARDIDSATQLIDEAVQHWKSQSPASTEGQNRYLTLLKASAEFKRKHRRLEEAAEAYTRLVKEEGSTSLTTSLMNLVAVLSLTNPTKAAEYASRFPDDPSLQNEMKSLDLTTLENLPPKRVKTLETEGTAEASESTTPSMDADLAAKIALKKRERRKRKKKKRLPKEYDPKVPPDPERWLPKRERSSYRRRGRRNIPTRTQGDASASKPQRQQNQPSGQQATGKPQPAREQEAQQATKKPVPPQQQASKKPAAQQRSRKKKKGRRR